MTLRIYLIVKLEDNKTRTYRIYAQQTKNEFHFILKCPENIQ